MTLELGDFLAAGNLPEPDRPVVAAGGQQRARGVHGRPRVSTPGGTGLVSVWTTFRVVKSQRMTPR